MPATFYDLLGVAPDADVEELRRAYRRMARVLHPDVTADTAGDAQRTMALLNEAWATLSDPERRAAYDRTELVVAPSAGSTGPSAPRPRRPVSRREDWFAGVRVQVVRLAAEAARSASLTLSMRRRGRRRAEYDAVVPDLVEGIGLDIESRVRRARALGAAPLDLGLVTTLVGIRAVVAVIGREVLESGAVDDGALVRAEMLDRMWDTVAHEVRHDLVSRLGGNPHLHRWLTGHDH